MRNQMAYKARMTGRLGRLKIAFLAAIAVICVGLASCGGSGASNQPGASPSSSHGSGWG